MECAFAVQKVGDWLGDAVNERRWENTTLWKATNDFFFFYILWSFCGRRVLLVPRNSGLVERYEGRPLKLARWVLWRMDVDTGESVTSDLAATPQLARWFCFVLLARGGLFSVKACAGVLSRSLGGALFRAIPAVDTTSVCFVTCFEQS